MVPSSEQTNTKYMKLSIVIAEGIKQVMMTPENDQERDALKWITPSDDIEIATVWGTYDDEPSPYSYNTGMSKGGNLRRFAEKDSLMFVLTPKEEKPKKKSHDPLPTL